MGQEVEVAERGGSLGAALASKQAQFHAALPAHMPVARFMRVVMTAVQNNPKLASADRASLFNSCLKAAQDGLLPDGREGALVIYSTKVDGQWIDKVSWMPMIAGIRKKVRNSGEITAWDAIAVRARDAFEYEQGTEKFLRHKPFVAKALERMPNEDPEEFNARWKRHSDAGMTIAFYSIATLKDGTSTFEVMSRSEVEYVRDTFSKKDREGKFSPAWRNSFDEMGKKTVARRHSKTLPMSTDLDDLLRRDDELYNMAGESDKAAGPKVGRNMQARIDHMIESTTPGKGEPETLARDDDGTAYDPETGEIHETGSEASETSGAQASTDAGERGGGQASQTSARSDPAAAERQPKGDKAAGKPATAAKGGEQGQKARKGPTLESLLPAATDAASRGHESLDEYVGTLDGDSMVLLQPRMKELRKIAASVPDDE
jgi:recombination protein RecT